MMYCDEIEHWIAEERLEEARSQARLMAALLRERQESTNHNSEDQSQNTAENHLENVQVVEDEDEVTTIRRPVLPDLNP